MVTGRPVRALGDAAGGMWERRRGGCRMESVVSAGFAIFSARRGRALPSGNRSDVALCLVAILSFAGRASVALSLPPSFCGAAPTGPIATGAALLLAFAAFGAAFVPPFGSCRRLSSEPILSPRGSGFESAGTFNPAVVKENGWEKVGQVSSVVFVEGLVREGSRWLFYYGGADRYVGVAVAQQR